MIERKSKHEFRVALGDTSLVPYTTEDLQKVLKWCREIYGPPGRNPKHTWRYGWVVRQKDLFYFRNEKDAMFFVLRWS